MWKQLILLTLVIASSCNQQQPKEEDKIGKFRNELGLLNQIPDSNVVSFQQIELEYTTKKFHISRDLLVTDVFKQTDIRPPQIDILIVIDNSGSMEEEQTNLSDKLIHLIADLSDIEWQINVITTETTCVRLPGELPITPETPNMSDVFERAVRAGTNGSPSETGLENTVDHLRQPCDGEAWKREGAHTAVLLVTDEEEDFGSRYRDKADLFITDIEGLGYEPKDDFVFYGIIGHESKPCDDVSSYGVTHAQVIEETDGLWGDICAADYTNILKAIAEDIRKNLKFSLPLTYEPAPSTIEAILDDLPYDGSFTIVDQDLILNEALPEGATMVVQYQRESSRNLKIIPEDKTYSLISVRYDQQMVEPSGYKFDPVENIIILTFDPEVGSTIYAELLENQGLISEFKFPIPETNTLRCFVDKKDFNSAINVDRGVISFSPPIPEGKKAICHYN